MDAFDPEQALRPLGTPERAAREKRYRGADAARGGVLHP
jgi:hypothetical protein